MMRSIRILMAAALLTLPIAALARAPNYSPPGAAEAAVRFSLRMNVADRENCRLATPEELEALPIHMRSPEVCTRDAATFLLVFTIDGARTDTIPLARGGFKGDRPLVAVEERRLPPGDHFVKVELLRVSRDGTDRVADLAAPVQLGAGDVALITFDAGSGQLRLR
jgi:hypothetical protein